MMGQGLPVDVPVQLGREQAQELARQKLADRAYQQQGESWVARLLRWLFGRVGDLLDGVSGRSPGGWVGVALLLIAVVALIGVLRWRLGALRRPARTRALFDDGEDLTQDAALHRRLADAAAAEGRWADAVRERARAVVRELEERGLLDPRPGRTAQEAAVEGGGSLPAAAAQLAQGALIFEDIWYGGQAADSTAYARLVEVDEAVCAARPQSAGSDSQMSSGRFTAAPQ